MAEQLDPEKIREAQELARKLGEEFKETQRTAKELDTLIAGYRQRLKENNSELAATYDYFKEITNQLKKTDIVTNDLKKGYAGLASIAQTIQSVQLGNQTLSLKEISSLKDKVNLNKSLLTQALETRKRDEEAFISRIANEKKVSTEQVKAAFEAQKLLDLNEEQRIELGNVLKDNNNLSDIERKIINDSLKDLRNKSNTLKGQVSILGEHANKLNELASLRKTEEERQKTLNGETQVLLDKLKEEEDRQGRINKLLGLGGNTIDFASKGMDKLGLGGLKTYLNFDKAKEAMDDTAAKIDKGVASGGRLTVLSSGLKGLFAGMGKALLDPLTIMMAILDAFKTADTATGDLAKEFNKTYREASNIREELNGMANSSNDINVTTKGLQESMVAVGKSLGTNAMLNEKDLVTFTKLREQAGYTNEELVGIQQLSLVNGKTLEDNTKEILGGAQAYAAQNKFVVNEKEVLREVSKTSAAIKLTLGGSAEAVAKAVVQAKQFGLNLQQAEQISKSLLQFEDSIGSELEAELLTGKQFNFERARSLALQGDIAGAAAEVAKQVGTAAQFGKMNVIQQEALAKSVGMTREDLAKSLMDREALTKLSAREGENAQQAFNRLVAEVGLEKAKEQLGNDQLANQFAQQSVQERFNATIEKLKEIFISLVQPLLPVLDIFALILKPVGLIAGFIGKIVSGITGLIGGLTESKTLLISIASIVTGLGVAMNFVSIKSKATAMWAKATEMWNNKTLILEKGKSAVQSVQLGYKAAMGSIEAKQKLDQKAGLMKSIGQATMKVIASLASIPVLGWALGLAAAGTVAALGYKYLADDMISTPGYGKRTLLAPEGAIQLNDKDTVIAGTKLTGNDTLSEPGKTTKLKPEGSITPGETSQNASPQIDLSPLIAEMQSVKNILNQILNKEGTVYLDSNKVGTTLTSGFSTFKSQ